MAPSDTIHTLNRVLALLAKSFPQYLRYSRPYIPRSRKQVRDTLDEIADDQTMLAERISQLVLEAGGLPDTGAFPMEFTDTNDLGIDHLLREAIRYQREDLAVLQDCREELAGAPTELALVEETIGMAKGHLESLEELQADGASKQPAAVG